VIIEDTLLYNYMKTVYGLFCVGQDGEDLRHVEEDEDACRGDGTPAARPRSSPAAVRPGQDDAHDRRRAWPPSARKSKEAKKKKRRRSRDEDAWSRAAR
jgi:hypothetical protein